VLCAIGQHFDSFPLQMVKTADRAGGHAVVSKSAIQIESVRWIVAVAVGGFEELNGLQGLPSSAAIEIRNAAPARQVCSQANSGPVPEFL